MIKASGRYGQVFEKYSLIDLYELEQQNPEVITVLDAA